MGLSQISSHHLICLVRLVVNSTLPTFFNTSKVTQLGRLLHKGLHWCQQYTFLTATASILRHWSHLIKWLYLSVSPSPVNYTPLDRTHPFLHQNCIRSLHKWRLWKRIDAYHNPSFSSRIRSVEQHTYDCSLEYNQLTTFPSYRWMISPSSLCKLAEGSSYTSGPNSVHSTCWKDEVKRITTLQACMRISETQHTFIPHNLSPDYRGLASDRP